jgi:hypothetical protein
VKLTVDGKVVGTQSFKLLPDPRMHVTQADYDAQAALALKIRDRFSAANSTVKTIRYLRWQLEEAGKKLSSDQKAQLDNAAQPMLATLAEVEDSLYQTQNRASEDPLNYPIRLNNRIGALMGVVTSSDGRPTKQSYEVYDVLDKLLNVQLDKYKKAMDAGLPKVNAVLKAAGQAGIEPKAEDTPVEKKGE